jgi:hypothetical protein
VLSPSAPYITTRPGSGSQVLSPSATLLQSPTPTVVTSFQNPSVITSRQVQSWPERR